MLNKNNHFEKLKKTELGNLYIQGWYPDDEIKAVICLVHGLGEYSGRYSNLASFLTQKNYSLMALDLPGHGKSFGSRGHIISYEVLMDMINILLKDAKENYPELPIFLYGHSMGGNLVLNYVLRQKPHLKGLIVSAPWLKLGSEPPFIKAALGKLMNYIVPKFSQSNGIDPKLLSHSKEVVQKYEQDPLAHDKISARLYVEVAQAGIWALENSSKLKVPTLLMIGTEDKIVSTEAVNQFIIQVPGNYTYKTWDGFYHEIHNELENEKVYTYLLDWLKEC